MNMRLFSIVLPALMFFCCSREAGEPSAKYTASLTKAIAVSQDSESVFHVLCIPSKVITEQMRSEVSEKTKRSEFVDEHLLKVECTDVQLRLLASLDWIERIDVDPEYKFDMQLRRRVQQLRRSDKKESFAVLGKCSKAISPELKEVLKGSGAQIGATVGDIFTAEVTLSTLYSLAAVNEVTLLQLSQTGNIK